MARHETVRRVGVGNGRLAFGAPALAPRRAVRELFDHANQICETFRKVSQVRIESKDVPIKLFLSESDLGGLNLSFFDFRGANLRKAQLQGAYLRGAQLQGATLRGVEIDRGQLCSSLTLFNIKLDSALLEQVKRECPELLKEPRINF